MNVDTIVQTGDRDRLLGSGRGPRRRRAPCSTSSAPVDGARRPRQGQRRRRRDEEPSRRRREDLRHARRLGIEPPVVTTSPIKIACHVARDDVDRAVRASTRRSSLARARPCVRRADRRRRRDRRRRPRHARAASRARLRRRPRLRVGPLGRTPARRDDVVEEATPEALEAGEPRRRALLGRHVGLARARAPRRRAAAPSRSTSPRRTGSRTASRSSSRR